MWKSCLFYFFICLLLSLKKNYWKVLSKYQVLKYSAVFWLCYINHSWQFNKGYISFNVFLTSSVPMIIVRVIKYLRWLKLSEHVCLICKCRRRRTSLCIQIRLNIWKSNKLDQIWNSIVLQTESSLSWVDHESNQIFWIPYCRVHTHFEVYISSS